MLRTTLALTLSATLTLPVLGIEPAAGAAAVRDPAALVNPFIGTQNEGNTFPGASLPFGMVQISPDTLRADNDDDEWSHTGYDWDHPRIRGFSQLHPSGVGCSLGGNLPIMPTTGDLDSTQPGANASEYSHEHETAEPGYYSVVLDDYGVTAELTATTRTGTQRYTYPETEQAHVFLYAGRALREVTHSSVTVLDDRTVEVAMTGQGFCQDTEPYTVYTVTAFDRPFESATVFSGDSFHADATSTSGSGNRGVAVTFDATEDQDVEVTTATSWVDLDGARRNLAAEGTGTFDDTRAAAYETWNEWLGRIAVAGGTETQQRTFYSSLYRALLAPNTGSDVDGRYTGWDQEIHTAEDFTYYQTWSLWDTYRTQQQLLSLIAPEQMTDMARSILKIDEHSGWLPRWGYATVETNIMTGDPVAPFLASAYQQGLLAGFEEEVLAALVHNADTVPPADHPANGRAGLPHYLAHGYVPHEPGTPKPQPGDFDLHHGASATLEYAVADGAIAAMAADLGHAETAARFGERAQSYRSVFDPRTGFFRARNAEGAFIGSADPAHGVGFHEGSGWHYMWHVQHDVPGLIDLVGGAEEAVERLDAFFAYDALLTDRENTVRNVWVNGPYDYYGQDTYNPQNEPNIHAPYVYQWAGQPWKTVDVVHGALTLYTDGPSGVTGNDDMGTMSSWHVLASIGLYPSVPGADTWALTTPVFTDVTISGHGAHGGDVRISAPGSSEENRYVSTVTVNGRDHDRSHVAGDVLRAGADIAYTLSTEPGDWATGPDAAPPALSHVDVERYDLAASLSPSLVLVTASEEAVEVPLTLDIVATGPGTVTGTVEVSTAEPITLTAPIEWSIESGNLPMTESFTIPLTLAAGARPGEYPVTVTVSDGDREIERQATVVVGRQSPLASYFNNTGIGDEGADNADLDHKGWYLLRGALADAGIVQGRMYQVPGTDLSYQLAVVPAGAPDNIAADGQQVDLTGALEGATRFSFVGTGTSGNQIGDVTVRLDDGSSFDTTVAFTDWCSHDLVRGNVLIARTSHRGANAGTDGVQCALFATAPVSVPDGREVVGIDLPTNRDLHVFAIASDAGTQDPTLESLAASLEGYVASGDVAGPIAGQLAKAVEQAQGHSNGGRRDQAVRAVERFIRHLDNPKRPDRLSAEAREDLRAQAVFLLEDLQAGPPAEETPLSGAYARLIEFYANGLDVGWEDASTVSTLVAYSATTGDDAALDMVTDFLDERVDDPQALQNDFSDDTAWWGVAAVDAYRATDSEAYLGIAQRLSDYIEDTFTDPAMTCGGGVQWRLGEDHVATISTTLAIQLNAALAQHVVDDGGEYLQRALADLAWLHDVGMFDEEGRLLDGVDRSDCGTPVGHPYSYLQGTFVSGQLELFAATADSQYLEAAAAMGEVLTGPLYTHSSGALTSPNDAWDQCMSDGALFKASTIRGLDELDARLAGHLHRDYLLAQREIAVPLAVNHVYSIRWWESPESEYHGSANCQTSAVRMLIAAANADGRGTPD